MEDVIVVIGAGSIGQAIARRIGTGKLVLVADLKRENADVAAKVMGDAGFEMRVAIVDVSSRESVHALAKAAAELGSVTGVIHAAGVSPSQASRRRSCTSTSTARRWCWKRSAKSSPRVARRS